MNRLEFEKTMLWIENVSLDISVAAKLARGYAEAMDVTREKEKLKIVALKTSQLSEEVKILAAENL